MKNDDCRLCAKGGNCELQTLFERGDKKAESIVLDGQICDEYEVDDG